MITKPILTTLILFLLLPNFLLSQSIDVLKLKIETAIHDGDCQKAARLSEKIRVLYQKNNECENWAKTYTQTSTCHYYNGNYIEMEQCLRNAEQVANDCNLDSISDFRAVLSNLYGIYFRKNKKPEKAILFFKRMKDIYSILLKEESINKDAHVVFDSLDIGIALQNIATQYRALSDHHQAIDYYNLALPYLVKNNKILSTIYNNIAFQQRILSQNEEALKNYKKALQLLTKSDKNHDRLKKKIYLNLAAFYEKANDLEKARNYLQKANEIIPEKDDKYWSMYERTEGLILSKEKKHRQAQTHFINALNFRQKKKHSNHSFIASVYKNIGDNYLAQNQTRKTLLSYQKAMTYLVSEFNDSLNISNNPMLQQNIISRPDLLDILKAKAQVLHSNNQLDLSLETYQLAIKLIDNLRVNYKAEGSKYILLNKTLPIYEEAIEVAFKLGEAETMFTFAEKSKATLLLESVKDKKAKLLSDIPDTLLTQERDLKIQIAYYEQQLYQEQDKSKIREIRAHIFALKSKKQHLLKKLEETYPTYFQLKYDIRSISVTQIQQEILDNESVLIEFFEGEHSIFLFRLTNKEIKTFKLEKSVDFKSRINEFLSLVSNVPEGKQDFAAYTETAFYFYDNLLKKPLQTLSPKVKQLIFVPDGLISYLPLHAFITNPLQGNIKEARYDTLNYLLKEYQISYNYSSTILWEMNHLVKKNRSKLLNFIGFAPGFLGFAKGNKRNGDELTELINSLREVTLIDSIVGGKIFVEKEANKDAFSSYANQSKILHLATHATINDTLPMNSQIHLFDKEITFSEISNLPLNTELVVLSACQTGTGELRKGEGLMTLARAFSISGSSSLIASLWKIPDYETSDIMIDFYQHLSKGRTKDKALRDAQLTYLNKSSHSFENKHPYFWAAFVQIGSTKPIFEEKNNYPLFIGGLILLSLLLVSYFQFRSREVV